jgi:hypothetical protein
MGRSIVQECLLLKSKKSLLHAGYISLVSVLSNLRHWVGRRIFIGIVASA